MAPDPKFVMTQIMEKYWPDNAWWATSGTGLEWWGQLDTWTVPKEEPWEVSRWHETRSFQDLREYRFEIHLSKRNDLNFPLNFPWQREDFDQIWLYDGSNFQSLNKGNYRLVGKIDRSNIVNDLLFLVWRNTWQC